jgi:flagellar assembly protein FliH
MMSSSERGGGANPYSRFIPREELEGFSSWQPGAFGDVPSTRGMPPVKAPVDETQRAAEQQGAVQAARQSGYQDGYRDGLVALDSFKQSFAAQMAAQLGTLVSQFDAEFAQLEQQIADTVARTATALAPQVVRSELAARPELVAAVAAQAVEAVLLSAKHIRVHVHPQDHALVAQGAADVLSARGARLIADAAVSRGGCRVESDLGRIDAGIEARWAQAAESLGQSLTLDDDARAE